MYIICFCCQHEIAEINPIDDHRAFYVWCQKCTIAEIEQINKNLNIAKSSKTKKTA